jgi:cell wall-associated NlpC family hydrolase
VGTVVLAVVAAVLAGPGPGTKPGSRATSAARHVVAARAAAAVAPVRCQPESVTCRVVVNVATVWVNPAYPRPVIDHPALTNPAHPDVWVASMTYAEKLWLASGPGGKVNTQAVYGTKVRVTGGWVAPNGVRWVKVAIPSQPTPKDGRGYPGWVPARQLTSTPPATAPTTAVIVGPTARLWSSWTPAGVAGTEVMRVSYGTRLPLVRASASYVVVTLIGGRQVAVWRSAVKLHPAGSPWGATPAKLVAGARQFLGLQYLWAGTSGFGYDCSGFTYTLYHAFGIMLARDADQQAVHGTAIAPGSLQPGDLVFYRSYAGGPIGHVGMYVGGGNIIDAPQTGQPVKTEPLSSHANYAGARRYL